MKWKCKATLLNVDFNVNKIVRYCIVLSSFQWKKHSRWNFCHFIKDRSSRSEVFCKKGILRPATFSKMNIWRRCFQMNFAKFLRTPFYRKPLDDCFCQKSQKKVNWPFPYLSVWKLLSLSIQKLLHSNLFRNKIWNYKYIPVNKNNKPFQWRHFL